jgi:MarR family transcriptional regulator, transcriptional regulator for hemolysin
MALDPEDAVPPLGFLLVRIAEDVDRRFVAALAELGLRPRELRTLVLVDRHPGMSQRALAERLAMDPGNLVALLDGMDARGLLVRERDPADRRRSTLRLTRAGERLLARASDATHAVEDAVFGALSDDERAAFTRTALRVFAGSNPGAVPPALLEPGSAPA